MLMHKANKHLSVFDEGHGKMIIWEMCVVEVHLLVLAAINPGLQMPPPVLKGEPNTTLIVDMVAALRISLSFILI